MSEFLRIQLRRSDTSFLNLFNEPVQRELQTLHSLPSHFPSPSLVSADFSLPPISVRGITLPLMQVSLRGGTGNPPPVPLFFLRDADQRESLIPQRGYAVQPSGWRLLPPREIRETQPFDRSPVLPESG